MTTLILASSSRYRQALLRRLGLPFRVVRPDIDETAAPGETAEALAPRLARAKANRVANAYAGAVVIASDQVAVVKGASGTHILGKPGGRRNAIAQLNALSGGEAQFLTSLCVRGPNDGEQVDTVVTRVHFRAFDESEAARYVDREQPFDCAGAFRCEGLGVALFECVEGEDPNALIGLPLIRLCTMLRHVGLDPLG